MRKNIFLTGAPSSGKSTVIRKVIDLLEYPVRGFYTQEECIGGRRVGFVMKTLDGQSGYLAHQDIKSDYYFRRFGVSISNIETIAVASILPKSDEIIILDEIGKMECFSKSFCEAALEVLDATNLVLGTITLGGDDFILGIKARDDIEILKVTLQNRDELPHFIHKRVLAFKKFGKN